MAQFGAIDEPEADRDNTCGEENDGRRGLPKEKPAIEGGEDGAKEAHEGEESGGEALEHEAV